MNFTPVSAVSVKTVTPCVCCRERAHARIPDPDLEGYVCRQCAHRLQRAVERMSLAEIRGCVPERDHGPRDNGPKDQGTKK